ncbi:L-xylulose/3-keto-L-gulonate kinase, partial [Haemophilus influenzae]
KL